MGESEWNTHRAEIERFYVHEDQPLKALITFMALNHDFCRSKAQYERQFKKWQWQKNPMKSKDWKIIARKVLRRQLVQGKESDVYIDGVRCPPAKVLKETSRPNSFVPTWEILNGTIPQTPEGITVSTPASRDTQTIRDIPVSWLQFFRLLNWATYWGHLIPLDTASPPFLPVATETDLSPEPTSIIRIKLDVSLLEGVVESDPRRVMWVFGKSGLNDPARLESMLSTPGIRRTEIIESLFRCALRSHDVEAVATILNFGVDPNQIMLEDQMWLNRAIKRRPLEYAILQQAPSLAKVLIIAGANVDYVRGCPRYHGALQQAVEDSNTEMINVLLEAGFNVNEILVGYGGATALQIAAIKGDLMIAQLLLEKGADANADGAENGATALEYAAQYGQMDMIHLLLNNGALITGRGEKPYHRAVELAEKNAHYDAAGLLRVYKRLNVF